MIDRESWSYVGYASIAAVAAYSDQYSTSYPATNAVDGNTGTYWRTHNPTGAYITLELFRAYPISTLEWYVSNTTYRAVSFTVSGSNDGADFVELYTGSCTTTSGWQTFTWENEVPYRYIKVTCNTGNSSRLYTYELRFGYAETLEYDKSYGKYLVAVFDGPVSAPTENDLQHFSVTAPLPVVGEDGYLTVKPMPRTIVSAVPHPDVANALLITLDTTQRIDESWKPVVFAYDGTGSLTGYGRPVEAFEVAFEPQGIAYKGDQNDEEHIEIKSIEAVGTLIRVSYSDYSAPAEHIEITGIMATGILTHINDI